MLSDEMYGFVLFMLVQCTAYQLMTPIGAPSGVTNFNWTRSLSVLYVYLDVHHWDGIIETFYTLDKRSTLRTTH